MARLSGAEGRPQGGQLRYGRRHHQRSARKYLYAYAHRTLYQEKRPIRYMNKRSAGYTTCASFLFSCGGRTRTCDLQVMSLASYQLLHSAMLFFLSGCKGTTIFLYTQLFCKKSANISPFRTFAVKLFGRFRSIL